jgi:hypothetical protein
MGRNCVCTVLVIRAVMWFVGWLTWVGMREYALFLLDFPVEKNYWTRVLEVKEANVPNVPARTSHGNGEKTFKLLIRKGFGWNVPAYLS